MKERIEAINEKLAGGVTPAMATPLDEIGYHVNLTALPALIDFLIEAGVKGLFVGGTTGEGLLLTAQERMLLHEETVRLAAGRVPTLVHVGDITTANAAQLAQHAAAIGVDAIVALTPIFYAIPDGALLEYFAAIAERAPTTPFYIYDMPHMAVNGISPQLVATLAQQLPTFAGLKTSRPDAQMIRQLLTAVPDHAIVLVGNERIALGTLAMGASGQISGLATAVPELFVALNQAVAAGDQKRSRELHEAINQALDLLPAGYRIGAIKSILVNRGINVGRCVPPRPMPVHNIWEEIKPILISARLLS